MRLSRPGLWGCGFFRLGPAGSPDSPGCRGRPPPFARDPGGRLPPRLCPGWGELGVLHAFTPKGLLGGCGRGAECGTRVAEQRPSPSRLVSRWPARGLRGSGGLLSSGRVQELWVRHGKQFQKADRPSGEIVTEHCCSYSEDSSREHLLSAA